MLVFIANYYIVYTTTYTIGEKDFIYKIRNNYIIIGPIKEEIMSKS